MAISDTITSMYENVGEVYDTLTNVEMPTNKNIENIPSTIRKSYLNIMNNGYQDIWDNWDKVNGSGTSVSLNNTEEAPMSLTYKGNTLQNGTPTPDSPQDIHVVSGDNSIEVCGKNLFDEEIELGNINPANGELSNSTSRTRSKNFIEVQPNKTYVLTRKVGANRWVVGYTANKVGITDGNSSGQASALGQVGAGQNIITFTTTATTKYIKWYDTSSTDLTEQVMINEGSTPLPYEPYQSASYPISLGVENLFDKSLSVANKYINSGDGTLLNSSSSSTSDFINVSENTKYTISGYGTTSYYKVVSYYNSSKTFISSNTVTNTNNTFSITTPSNAKFLRFHYPTTSENQVQLEKGTKANSYTPYGTTPIELCKIGTYQDKIDKSTGKNLFNKDITPLSYGATINVGEDYIKITRIVGTTTTCYASYEISVEQNTNYYLSLKALVQNSDLEGSSSIVIRTGASGGTVIKTQNLSISTTTEQDLGFAFNSGANSTLYVWFYTDSKAGETSSTGTRVITYKNIQVEAGNSETSYEPYGTDWYLKKEIGKVVLDGSENWNNDGGTHGTDYRHNIYYANRMTIPTAIGSNNTYISNYFIASNVGTDVGELGKFYMSGTWLVFPDKNKVYDLAQWETWLGTNKPIIYYVLATPTYEYITDTTLISQLEEAKKSYESQTNISQENNDLPFELEVVALGVM